MGGCNAMGAGVAPRSYKKYIYVLIYLQQAITTRWDMPQTLKWYVTYAYGLSEEITKTFQKGLHVGRLSEGYFKFQWSMIGLHKLNWLSGCYYHGLII